MVKIVPIIDPGHASNAIEEDGNFSDTFIRDRGKVWGIPSPLLHVTDSCPHVKSAMKNLYVWKSMLAFYDHFWGTNNMDHLQKQAEVEIQNLIYAGERKN